MVGRLVFGAAGIPAAFGGAALGKLVPQRWLLLAFAARMVIVAVRMLRGGENHTGACRTQQGGINWRTCLPKSVLAGATVGVLTGLFGVGVGFIIAPALTLLLGLGAQQAVATSLVVVLINSVAGLAAHAGSIATIDHRVLVLLAGAAVAAVASGSFAVTTNLPLRTVLATQRAGCSWATELGSPTAATSVLLRWNCFVLPARWIWAFAALAEPGSDSRRGDSLALVSPSGTTRSAEALVCVHSGAAG